MHPSTTTKVKLWNKDSWLLSSIWSRRLRSFYLSKRRGEKKSQVFFPPSLHSTAIPTKEKRAFHYKSFFIQKPQMGAPQAIVFFLILLQTCKTAAQHEEWNSATATYTKETNGSIIIGTFLQIALFNIVFHVHWRLIGHLFNFAEGACGYGDLHRATYGKYSAGLSTMLFNRGSTCGACFELRCVDHILWCRPGSPSVILTATDFCPPNYGLSSDYGGWCNFPKEHFEMSEAAFVEIAERRADLVPVQYRRYSNAFFLFLLASWILVRHMLWFRNLCRVKCERRGGLRFTVSGSSHFYQVLVTNVGLDGEVIAVKVKGSKTGWIPMARNWGQNWQSNVNLTGQPLSFEVTTSNRKTLTSYNVAPANWQFGQTYEGKQF